MPTFCRTTTGTLEEVTPAILEMQDKILLNDEKRRYTDERFTVESNQLFVEGVLDRDTFALLGRSLGFDNMPTSEVIRDCPEFVMFQKRPTDKVRVLNTKTGKTFRQD